MSAADIHHQTTEVYDSLHTGIKEKRFASSLDFFIRYEEEGDDMLSQIATGDETWVSYPGIKATIDGMATHILSRQGQSRTNVVKAQVYGNSALGPAWCFAGLKTTQGTPISSNAYCANLRKLRRALQNKRHCMLSKGVSLLHDNARVHTSRVTRNLSNLLAGRFWTMHHAAPSDFHLFRYLKHNLGEKHFSDNEVKVAVNSWLSEQAAEFFEEGF
ncbi:histone-lysine N-methyltransferase SETMAR [Trichonephila clavipes]|nr:histone-lysine N-methyltransferase SETMAR [Trichonephila clavipes]